MANLFSFDGVQDELGFLFDMDNTAYNQGVSARIQQLTGQENNIALSDRDLEIFLSNLDSPPPPNEAFRKAAEDTKKNPDKLSSR